MLRSLEELDEAGFTEYQKITSLLNNIHSSLLDEQMLISSIEETTVKVWQF